MKKLSCGLLGLLVLNLFAATRPVMADDQLELVISDSGRNAAWSERLYVDRERGLTFDAVGNDKKPVGGILVGTSALEQLLVPMPNDATLDSFKGDRGKSLRDEFVIALAWRINQHVQPAMANRAPVFELRLLENASLTDTSDRAAYAAQFDQLALEAVGRVVEKYQTERKAQVHISMALADSGAKAFAQAIAACHPFKDTITRVDLVAGLTTAGETRQVIEELGGKRVRLFISQEVETPAMTAGRQEVADLLLNQYPGLSYYLVPARSPSSASNEVQQLPQWFDALAGTGTRRVEARRFADGHSNTTVYDAISPQQFRNPILGWDPVISLELVEEARNSLAAASTTRANPLPSGATPSGGMENSRPAGAALMQSTQGPTNWDAQIAIPGFSAKATGTGLNVSDIKTNIGGMAELKSANINVPGVANFNIGASNMKLGATFATDTPFQHWSFSSMPINSPFSSSSYGYGALNYQPVPVRGVLLQGAAEFEGEEQKLHTENISLIFQGNGGGVDLPRLRRFTTSLWAAYLSAEGPGISIDPVTQDADQYERHNVRYIGQVFNTDLARVMRETDYTMKQWAVGSTRPDIPGFLSPDQLSAAVGKRPLNRPSRFWLIPDELKFRFGGGMLLFSGGRMTVRTEYLDNNPNGEKNPANELFAKWLTDNYDTVSQHYPVYRELFDYAQSTALGTYLREAHVPMMWFLLSNRELILTEHSVKQVDAIARQSSDPNAWAVRISGGVEMDPSKTMQNKNTYVPDDATGANSVGVASAMAAHSDATSVTFDMDGKKTTSTSGDNLTLSASPATGKVVQTDVAIWHDYSKDTWHRVSPGLEIIRHYNPSLTSRASFGGGWHVLVPFRLQIVTPGGMRDLGTAGDPDRVAMVNVLSGISDQMRLGKTGYVPEDEFASLLGSLVHRIDGTWEADDRLGCKFVFDAEGDLLAMQLRPAQDIQSKLANGQEIDVPISAYAVRYRYEHKLVAGVDHKMLVQISQEDKTAQLDWRADGNTPVLAGISVRNAGGAVVSSVNYELDKAGKLDIAALSSGLRTQMVYSNDAMNVGIRNLESVKK